MYKDGFAQYLRCCVRRAMSDLVQECKTPLSPGPTSFLFVHLPICFVLFTKLPVFSVLVSENQKSRAKINEMS